MILSKLMNFSGSWFFSCDKWVSVSYECCEDLKVRMDIRPQYNVLRI